MRDKMDHIIQSVSFAEAEDMEVEYYSSLDWKQSVSIVEEMRRNIWDEAYRNHNEIERIIKKASLTEDRDDFE